MLLLEFHDKELADAPEEVSVLDVKGAGAVAVLVNLIGRCRHLCHNLRVVGVQADVIVVTDVHL